MKIRKRYLLLILIALLPLYFLIHPDDYCFGVAELLIIGGLAILFIIVFLVVFFNNLYGISLKRELFDANPLIIAVVYAVFLYLFINYHDENVFKTKKMVFKTEDSTTQNAKITLFTDKTFEFKTVYREYRCVNKGVFRLTNDTLYLKTNHTLNNPMVFDSVYYYDKNALALKPMQEGLKIFKKAKKSRKKEVYNYFSEE
jgi:hypothetical protein